MDPPYNTGNDSFNYNDRFNHSTWLVFMKNRLEIARELLKDDGVIFVQCDDNEQAYLKVLMDEIFGRDNFIGCITIKSSSASGVKISHANKTILKSKDYILTYKKVDISLKPQYIKKESWDNHYMFYVTENKEVISLLSVLKQNKILSEKQTLNDFDINNKEHKSFYLKFGDKIVRKSTHRNNEIKDICLSDKWRDKIYFKNDYMYFNDIMLQPISKSFNYFINGLKYDYDISNLLCDLWIDIDFQNTQNQGSVNFVNAKKPEQLLYRIIDMATNENDIVLDFFAGSGTTAAVAMKMNRQFIAIEQMDYIETITKERLKKVIDGEQGGISKAVNWQGGGEFVYAELAPFNETAKQQILACENLDDIKTLFNELCERYFLKYNVSVKEFSQIIKKPEFQTLPLDEQKQMMLEMLDLNQMYVSLSEMDDEQFAGCLNDDDKALSRAFYQSVKNQAEKKDGE
ncbi:TPA: site-specific DNA-methyltransferase [Haemophilus influenzae]